MPNTELWQNYADLVRDNCQFLANWPPAGNTVSVGDIGIYNEGYWDCRGNVLDPSQGYNVSAQPVTGAKISKINAVSKNTQTLKFELKAGVKSKPVSAIPATGEATYEMQYTSEESWVGTITFNDVVKTAIQSGTTPKGSGDLDALLDFLAAQYGDRFARGKTTLGLVTGIHTASAYLMMASTNAKSGLSVAGSAKAMSSYAEGSVSAGLKTDVSKSDDLQCNGTEETVVGMDLYRYDGDARRGKFKNWFGGSF